MDNPQYKPNDARSGTKFLKAENITRADILVYDVQVFESSQGNAGGQKLLRVAVPSLKKLSEVRPDVQSIPAVPPATHRNSGRAGCDQDELQFPLEKNAVVVLRRELEGRGLDTSGLKAVLVDRLRAALECEGECSFPECQHTYAMHKLTFCIYRRGRRRRWRWRRRWRRTWLWRQQRRRTW